MKRPSYNEGDIVKFTIDTSLFIPSFPLGIYLSPGQFVTARMYPGRVNSYAALSVRHIGTGRNLNTLLPRTRLLLNDTIYMRLKLIAVTKRLCVCGGSNVIVLLDVLSVRMGSEWRPVLMTRLRAARPSMRAVCPLRSDAPSRVSTRKVSALMSPCERTGCILHESAVSTTNHPYLCHFPVRFFFCPCTQKKTSCVEHIGMYIGIMKRVPYDSYDLATTSPINNPCMLPQYHAS